MAEPTLRRVALVILLLTSLVFGALLIPSIVAGPLSLMAFDQSFSAAAILFVCCMLSFPFLVLVSIPGSWICYRRRVYRAAITFSVLPTVNLLVIASLFSS
jgi:O-antigen/teichoic acid export membrane protein